MTELLNDIEVILLDIEGTTTPIDFVTETLFPFARKHLESYLINHGSEMGEDFEQLAKEHAADVEAGNKPPDGNHRLEYLQWLMDQDRKSPALKSIQGKIWKQGYESGELKGEVYPDVVPALKRWKDRGIKIYIYSSGSVLAQKLLFGNSNEGDLLPYFEGHFDTEFGGKKEAQSYHNIAKEIGVEEKKICFFSDVQEELDAAATANCKTIHVVRANMVDSDDYEVIGTFDEVE